MSKDNNPVNGYEGKRQIVEEKLQKKEERDKSDRGGYHDRTLNTDKSKTDT